MKRKQYVLHRDLVNIKTGKVILPKGTRYIISNGTLVIVDPIARFEK